MFKLLAYLDSLHILAPQLKQLTKNLKITNVNGYKLERLFNFKQNVAAKQNLVRIAKIQSVDYD